MLLERAAFACRPQLDFPAPPTEGSVFFMRIEFSRMSGVFLSQRALLADNRSSAELLEEAKAALASFYIGDEFSLWPKHECASSAPERVQIVDRDGAVVVDYDLGDFLAETGRVLWTLAPSALRFESSLDRGELASPSPSVQSANEPLNRFGAASR
jgi:hypothetical protein